MLGVPGMSNNRRVGKIEKPRPLKMSTLTDHSLESVLGEMDAVAQQLNASVYDQNSHNAIVSLCENLKMFGPQLEKLYKDQLDRFYVSIRNGCRSDSISLHTRYRLLEVLELRAMQWHPNENHVSYFKQKLAQFEAEESTYDQTPSELSSYIQTPTIFTAPTGAPLGSPIYSPQYAPYPSQQIIYAPSAPSQPQHQLQHQQAPAHQIVPSSAAPGTPPTLAPGEVVKSSGKFVKPTRIPGKNYCKDEIVIRNADSGKVMGLKGRRVHMIEELSETIISFQRVAPGARERLVQITGPNDENISHAKKLIEETIRRNASPVRPEERSSIFNNMGGSSSSISSHTSDDTLQAVNKRNSMNPLAEESLGEYRYTVVHQNDILRITGNNLDLVRTAKLILDEYFNGDQNQNHLNLLSPDVEPSGTMTPPFPSPPSSKVSLASTSSGKSLEAKSQNEGETEAPKSGVITLLRQPLLPTSSKETIENIEKESSPVSNAVSNRRSLFAKTSVERAPDGEAIPSPPVVGSLLFSSRLMYSRDFLILCAASPYARLAPFNWSHVVRHHPSLVKKGWHHLPKLEAKLNEKGEASINSSESYLQDNDFVKPKELLNKENKWTLFRSGSTIDEEDRGNGN